MKPKDFFNQLNSNLEGFQAKRGSAKSEVQVSLELSKEHSDKIVEGILIDCLNSTKRYGKIQPELLSYKSVHNRTSGVICWIMRELNVAHSEYAAYFNAIIEIMKTTLDSSLADYDLHAEYIPDNLGCTLHLQRISEMPVESEPELLQQNEESPSR